jgi:hypothetical protein
MSLIDRSSLVRKAEKIVGGLTILEANVHWK